LAKAIATNIKNEKDIRRKIMAKQIRRFIGVALLLAAVSASAQTVLKVKVPFPFVTAGKSWPAADYKLEITTENGMLTLSSFGIGSAMMLTTATQRSGEKQAYLRFQSLSGRWVLQKVTAYDTARVPSRGKLEKELAKHNTSLQETLVASSVAH
jgi:hypothetical protein